MNSLSEQPIQINEKPKFTHEHVVFINELS